MRNKRNTARTFTACIIIAIIVLSVTALTGNWELSSFNNVASATATLSVAQYDETIPSANQSMYTTLDQLLTSFNQTLSSSATTKSSQQPIYATELLPADSNVGENLLAPTAMQGVINYLNALQALGIQGVTIDVSYPILVSSFANYTQYLSFYENVVAQVRSRGMKIDVESETPLLVGYPGLSFGSLSYANLTYTEYLAEDKQMLQTVIDNLHPDYLNIGTETDTLHTLLNYTEISTPQGWGTYISSLLDGLNKNTTKIAVGIGTWDPINYLYNTINDSAIDVINVHVYPIYGSYLSVLTQIGQLSVQYNKPINIDEMWLHKSVSTEGSLFASDANIRVRNDYAFWIPLDEKFMGVMAEYAQIYNVTYMSPFEGELLFAYLNYNSSTANLTNDQATQTVDQAASHNIQSNIISSFGAYYQNLISPSNSPTPTPTASATPTPNPTFTPTNAPTQAPTATASPHKSSPTQVPTATPYFSQSPTPTPSIPEFSTWIILPPFVVATLLSIIFRRKITKK
jgi:hypothetical protein